MPTPLRNSVQTPLTAQNGMTPQYQRSIGDAEFRADEGPLGALQTNLRRITYTLLELSVCAQDVHPPKPEDGPHGRVALKVLVWLPLGLCAQFDLVLYCSAEVISQLSELDAMKDSLRCRVPMQVLRCVNVLLSSVCVRMFKNVCSGTSIRIETHTLSQKIELNVRLLRISLRVGSLLLSR
jgi:hypothetical protein